MQCLLQQAVISQQNRRSAASLALKLSSLSLSRKAASKSDRIPVTASMPLLPVGKTLQDAKPTIVVFISGEMAQTTDLEEMLAQPLVREIYQPDDGVTPCFDVAIVAQAPRKRMAANNVNVFWDTSLSGERELQTYCGVQIMLDAGYGRMAMATLGGLVKLTYGPGEFEIVGMTAGHVLQDLLEEGLDDREGGGEGAEIEGDLCPPSLKGRFKYPRVMGSFLHSQTEEAEEEEVLPTAHDWVLFRIDDTLKIKPNLLQRPGSSSTRKGVECLLTNNRMRNGNLLTAAPPGSFPEFEPIEVALLSGPSPSNPRGTMLGLLSHLPGGIMMDAEKGFVDAYLLVLDEGLCKFPFLDSSLRLGGSRLTFHDGIALEDGDSGSWVVNPISLEVYGHAVADDLTGDVYVLPLHASLAEMKNRLQLESVDLPTTADFLDAALRATACACRDSSSSSSSPFTSETREGRPGEIRQMGILTARRNSRDRRLSEVLSLCEGLQLQQGMSNKGVLDDGDSGYGSGYGSVDSSKPGMFISRSSAIWDDDDDDDDYNCW